MRANRNRPDRESWIELMGAKDGEKVEDVDIFRVRTMVNALESHHNFSSRDCPVVLHCFRFSTLLTIELYGDLCETRCSACHLLLSL